MATKLELVVVGGGIVGLATAREYLLRHPGARVRVLEKETAIAQHQTGHNSGVIHSGIYYKPGSLKARLCVTGHAEMLAFCEARGIPYKRCGKLIVALDESELPRLYDLYERGKANGVRDLELIGRAQMREIEPYTEGVEALYSPHTGVTDFSAVARTYAEDIQAAGGEIVTATTVQQLHERGDGVTVVTSQSEMEARTVITCAGLYSDRISGSKDVRIVPFRGSYFRLSPHTEGMVNALIYPVPDPSFPFLGVHFTRTMNEDVLVGPNAVLAFAREGYARSRLHAGELGGTLAYIGFWRVARRFWRTGLQEMYRDYVKSAYLKTAQRYLPDLQSDDLLPGPSGVRAQALDADGGLVDDFKIKRTARVVHVQNAPSPAATSSLPIARYIVDQAEGH